MKTKGKKIKRKLSAIRKDNKGIETRVLIYILAAIALVAMLGVVSNTSSGVQTFMENAQKSAHEMMKKSVGADYQTGWKDPTS